WQRRLEEHGVRFVEHREITAFVRDGGVCVGLETPGEVLTAVDVTDELTGVAAAGTLTIAIRVYDTTIAAIGDNVHVLADGRSLASAGVIVEVVDEVVHVAVPERDAPAVALAASTGSATIAIAP
ncbi:MAG: hypothetical protein AAFY28_10035, partial [Actinomycetota bacterium]